ncbi:MAG: hypothetical protein HY650_04220 [Acidobacteria bacterium]|nr:hypothetical protein [Acidobacteriota bacterium]
MLDRYREEFSGFHRDLAQAGYEYGTGSRTGWDPAACLGRYDGLFRPETIAELRREWEATPESLPSQRAGVRALVVFAERGWVEGGTWAQDPDPGDGASALRAGLAAFAPCCLDLETPAGARHRSPADRKRDYRTHLESLEAGDARRAGRIAEREERACRLGYRGRLAMIASHTDSDFEAALAVSRDWMERSGEAFRAQLPGTVSRRLHLRMEDAVRFDEVYFRALEWYLADFPDVRIEIVFREMWAGLGLKLDQLRNLEITGGAGRGFGARAFCAPIRVPEEVKLVYDTAAGPRAVRSFLHAGGHGLHRARTSPAIPVEFRYGGDPAVGEAYAGLLESLIDDPRWLEAMIGFTPDADRLEAVKLARLLALRRATALLEYGWERSGAAPDASSGRQYAALLTEATGFRYHPAECLFEAESICAAATTLRAAALGSLIREHLRSCFGREWWRRRKAGEFLIDLWSAGQRYSAEELVRLGGFGAWSYEPMWAEQLGD